MDINTKEIIATLNRTIESYERMLKEVLIGKGERFDSAPYTQAIQTLYKILDMAHQSSEEKKVE